MPQICSPPVRVFLQQVRHPLKSGSVRLVQPAGLRGQIARDRPLARATRLAVTPGSCCTGLLPRAHLILVDALREEGRECGLAVWILAEIAHGLWNTPVVLCMRRDAGLPFGWAALSRWAERAVCLSLVSACSHRGDDV